MADFGILWKDRNVPPGTDGTLFTSQLMGTMHPSVNTVHEQFIVSNPDSRTGFVVKGGTYIKLLLPVTGGSKKHWIFGAEDDLVIADAQERLDEGRAFTEGRDYCVYLCYQEASPPTAEIVVSLNSTYPSGYNAFTSRKIGGFHTLCADAGTIANHPLSGYLAGDILPASLWCLTHRSATLQEGMAYDANMDGWCMIYLQSGTGANTKSEFGGVITISQSYSQHVEDLFMVGCRPLADEEFSSGAEGSNQQTNIVSDVSLVTTGGHIDTAGRRMISNIGLEDCCGLVHQYLSGWGYDSSQVAAWVADGTKGSVYQLNVLMAGGDADTGTASGSRCRYPINTRVQAVVGRGCRGRAPHRRG